MNQLIKDFDRLLNDSRIVIRSLDTNKRHVSNVASMMTDISVHVTTIRGTVACLFEKITLGYDGLTDIVRQVNTANKRTNDTLLYSLRYDHDGNVRRYSLAITSHANYELYGARHARISNALGEALYTEASRNRLNVINHYSDGVISHSIKSGAYQFYLSDDDE